MHWTQRPEVRAKISKTHKARGIKPPTDIRATGDKHHNWKGGVIYNNGYKLIKCPDPKHPYQYRWGYVYEHRWVMEQHIGRYLDPKEKVHHVDGDISNNRIDNLRLCNSNSDHFKIYHPNLNDKHRVYGPNCPRCESADTSSKGHRWYCRSCKRSWPKNGKIRKLRGESPRPG